MYESKTQQPASTRGGKREGAGRRPTGRKNVMFFITEDEKGYLKSCLEAYRVAGGPTHDEFETIVEARGQQILPLASK